jgi:hypothetical protein
MRSAAAWAAGVAKAASGGDDGDWATACNAHKNIALGVAANVFGVSVRNSDASLASITAAYRNVAWRWRQLA